jgi:hypothetical protein
VTRSPHGLALAAIAIACALLVSPARMVHAQEASVPADMQAELLAKLETYDRSFAERAGSTAKVLLVTRSGNGRSEASAADMRAALARLDRIGGLPHQEVAASYPGADALAQRCKSDQIAIVYLTPGLDEEVGAIKTSMTGVSVLTVTAVPANVPRGLVLGFELEAGKPKILLNLPQAKAQGVNFAADVMRLMKVFR